MAYENIRLRKRNLTVVEGYFWMFDEDTDSVVVKTDDGTLAYSYPLDTTITNTVKSLEYDGYNVWTLEATDTNEVTIRRWHIDNYVCTLRDTFVFPDGVSHSYDSNAFTVEHYHTSFSANEAAGQTTLSVTDGSNMSSGYTLVLGPNSLGQMEEVTVSTAGASSVNINGSTTYAYDSGDPISFYSNIWLFNNFNGTDSSTGALYKIDGYTGAVVTKTAGGAFKSIEAATFFNVPASVFGGGDEYNSICYIKGTSMIFLDPTDLNNSFGSMIMDNIEDDQATNITVYDVAIDGTNVYRLQRKATYYGTTASFADNTYNYQLSTLNSFIASISLQSDPSILPANGVNVSNITAIVKDQFNLPVASRLVYFTDDDPVGSINTTPVSTNGNGVAQTTYTAGTSAREVSITATAQQT
jgi:hypothetical protein